MGVPYSPIFSQAAVSTSTPGGHFIMRDHVGCLGRRASGEDQVNSLPLLGYPMVQGTLVETGSVLLHWYFRA
ncbi:MAG: hypothetical protein ACP5IL_09825 [Syntrophobacteraceae bacterium]